MRVSRTVLREAAGEIPAVYLPCATILERKPGRIL